MKASPVTGYNYKPRDYTRIYGMQTNGIPTKGSEGAIKPTS
jgi:hypothetical protein